MTGNLYTPPVNTEAERIKADKKSMSSCFSRCGFGVLVLIGATLAISFGLSLVMIVLELLTQAEILKFDINPYFEKYLLYINEVLIAVAIGLGALVLLKMPKEAPEKRPISLKSFLAIVCVCFTIAAVGSFIGNMWVNFWSLPFGGAGEDALSAVLTSIDPVQMFICTGIVAPIIEEFFFRKLLIDRMYKYGETMTIFVTALLFGLFHQNFSQFFYTFGIGLVLGYLYCRTGSYIHVTILHMVFNCLLGVIPALLSMEIMPFLEAAETYAFDQFAAMLPELLGEYAVPLIIFAAYMLFRSILELVGLIFVILKFKKLNLKKREPALSTADQLYAAFVNPGMIAACAVLCSLLLFSLIPI
ncbi:MAG: CPBP family intramembrane metalloprotease [Clostridia bacterium]|nr:CPBP family intramembrane metalloprotease [Clostridia bacterium]